MKDRQKSSASAPNLRGTLLSHEPLASYTTWRVGGIANKLYRPADVADLSDFLKSIALSEPLFWLGLGSNTLIRETGFAGTVILTQGCLKALSLISEDRVRVEAGVSCAKMARFCARNNLSGGEFWAGIPGTMGGALRMNAGCFNGETWTLVESVETIDRTGKLHIRHPDAFDVSYRATAGLGPDEWFVAATFRLVPGSKETSMGMIKTLLARRAETQPTSDYNCGSVFRNPPGHFAAQLIECCGLKGHHLGAAMVSEKHANFIINKDGLAKSSDIENLIQIVQNKVRQETQIELTREVHIVGEAPCPIPQD